MSRIKIAAAAALAAVVVVLYAFVSPISLSDGRRSCGAFAGHMLDTKAHCYTAYSELRLVALMPILTAIIFGAAILISRRWSSYAGAAVCFLAVLVFAFSTDIGIILLYEVPAALFSLAAGLYLARRAGSSFGRGAPAAPGWP
jgi:hypothetical protein